MRRRPSGAKLAVASLVAGSCVMLPAVPADAIVLQAHIGTSFGAASIPLGGTTSLSFSVSNPNPGTTGLTNVGFSDTLPTGVVITIVGTNDCGGVLTITTTSVSLSGAALTGGALCVISGFTVKGTIAGAKTNSVTVTSSAGTGNTATADLTVVAPPEVTTGFSNPLGGAAPSWLGVGDTAAVEIGVSNPNTTSSLTGVGLTDSLPAGLVVANPNGVITAGACTAAAITAVPGSHSVNLSGVTLAAGPSDPNSSCDFLVAVTSTANGLQTNSTGSVISNEGGVAAPATASIAVIAPGPRIYWSSYQTLIMGPANGIVRFGRLDGTVASSLKQSANSGGQEGTAIDAAAGRVYWADVTNSKISWASLDDQNRGDLSAAGAAISIPEGLAIDPALGLIFWANSGGVVPISYARLDGTGGGILNTAGATPGTAAGPAIDLASGRIYWASTSANRISYANLNGTGGGDLPTPGATVSSPMGVAIDTAARRIYWVNAGANKISYANLDGSGGADVSTSGATVNNPSGMAIDPTTGTLYWANQVSAGSVSHVIPGAAGGNLATPGVTPVGPGFPSLLYPPHGAGAPVVSGAGQPGSQLTCSKGSWAPDLLGAHFYRVPARFAYQWQRNGVNVAGATAATYTPTSTGSYTCRVTATNAAGTGTQTSAAHAIATLSAVKIISPMTLFQLNPTITVSYSATDSAGASAVSYDVQYRRAHWNATFGSWTPLAAGTASTSKTLSGSAGYEYCLRVRAHDVAGNMSAWSTKCVAIPLDDRALSTVTNDWARATSSGTYHDTLTTTSVQGAKLRLIGAQVDQVALVVTECATCGKVGIYLNGTLWTTINTYAVTARKKVIVLSGRFALQTATIGLRAMSVDRRVLIDGIGIVRT